MNEAWLTFNRNPKRTSGQLVNGTVPLVTVRLGQIHVLASLHEAEELLADLEVTCAALRIVHRTTQERN